VRLNPRQSEAAAHELKEIEPMLRKLVLGLVAAASLSAMALAPTEASAKSFGGRGFGRGGGFGGHSHFLGGGGFGGHHHFGGAGLGLGLGLDFVAAAIESSCRQVITTGGRVVNICN
jgi:hypothetical protein